MRDERVLREHQLMLLGMLKELDTICRKHQIAYMLFAGSALGAVRHNGFIPWDDDLDVVMLRSEYERFLRVAQEELDSQEYFLQKEFSNHWPMFFSKLRKNNTACIEKMLVKDKKQHQGIYIDIFPCDNLSDNKIGKRIQFWASKIVIAKSLDKRGYLTDSLLKKAFIVICRMFPHKQLLGLVQGKNNKTSSMVHTFLGGSSKYARAIYPRCWFTERIEQPFEDGVFPISAHYDELLTTLYGDYMTLPSEEERKVKEHFMKVDLERSYEDYLEWQSVQVIDSYTRSIR